MRTSRISLETDRILLGSLRSKSTTATTNAPPLRTLRSSARRRRDDEEPAISLTSSSELSSEPGLEVKSLYFPTPSKRRRVTDGSVTVKEEQVEEEEEKHTLKTLESVASTSTSTGAQLRQPKKTKRQQPTKKFKSPNSGVKVEPPPNWEEVYELTKAMRLVELAPVDTMGCESLAETDRSPRDRRFQTLVALMLSSQTKDTVTSVAVRGLQEKLAGVRFPSR